MTRGAPKVALMRREACSRWGPRTGRPLRLRDRTVERRWEMQQRAHTMHLEAWPCAAVVHAIRVRLAQAEPRLAIPRPCGTRAQESSELHLKSVWALASSRSHQPEGVLARHRSGAEEAQKRNHPTTAEIEGRQPWQRGQWLCALSPGKLGDQTAENWRRPAPMEQMTAVISRKLIIRVEVNTETSKTTRLLRLGHHSADPKANSKGRRLTNRSLHPRFYLHSE